MESTTRPEPRKLFRRSTEGRVAGVCAGIADYLDVDVTIVRLAWIVLSIFPGGFIGGLIAYIASIFVMEDAPGQARDARPRRRLTRSATDRKIAGVCGGIADLLDVDPTVVRLVWVVLTIIPGAIICGVIVYLVAWFIVPDARQDRLTAAPSAA
jgi:phage shock protein C